MAVIVQRIQFILFLIFCTLLAPIQSEAAPRKSATVTSGNNSAGLTLILDCPSESHITAVVVAGAAATVNFDISNDRVNWHTHTVLLSAASGTAFLDVNGGIIFARLTSTTTDVALTYEMGCKR